MNISTQQIKIATRVVIVLIAVVWTLLCGVTGAIIDRCVVNHKLDMLIVELKRHK